MEIFAKQHVLHLEWEGRDYPPDDDANQTTIAVRSPLDVWQLKEYFFFYALKRQLKKMNARENFTHVNFHIAYPSLVFYERIKRYLPEKMCVTEHWSIYKFNFYSDKKAHRLSSIFHHKLPLICVSESLGKSIQAFAQSKVAYRVIPNAVADEFQFRNEKRSNSFLTAAFWKTPKDPIPLLQAVFHLKQSGHPINLRIAGDGPLLEQMKQVILQHGMESEIVFLGTLRPMELCNEMNRARAFLMPSGFETFSVVSAEALCCGCPVLADNVGALSELINDSNGRLRHSDQSWEELIRDFDSDKFNRQLISSEASSKYSMQAVGRDYFQFLQSL